MRDHIVIKGARENNLKNIDVEIPRDALVVMTGLSGSGKSSLAFDTIFAEGQRRYMESLSSYARQFLGQMDKPDVDSIDGMSPAISIDQKTTSKNPRSTVGTVTEIYDYLRLLWARVGVPHCPKCGKEIRRQTVDQIVDQIAALPQATRVQILAPVIRARKGEHQKVFDDARRGGYVRVRVDGSIYDLTETITLDKNRKHNIEIVVDRVVIRPDQNRRLTDAVEIASALSGGLVLADIPEEKREILFSQNYACDDCGISIEELTPRMFSFNSPYGACPTCGGLGTRLRIDPALIIPDPSKSILDGGITASGWNGVKNESISRMYYDALAEKYHFQDQGYVAFTGLNLDRLQWFVNALLASFGWQEGKVFSLAALFNLAAAALILFCFVFSVWLVRGKARYPLGHRLVGAFFLAGAVCFALLYGLTNSGHSDRYLLPLAILFVPLLEIMLADCTPRYRPDACGLTALLAAILLLRAGTDYRAAAVATNPNQGAAQFLVQNGYRDGYASFWDGNVMTELTDGTLNVWTLTPNSVPELRPWLQVTSHLQTPPQGKIFFVISKWEAYGERQPTTQALADAMPEDALIYEDETVKIYGFASDEAMRQACGFAAFP
jgi:ABC-type dipeptide/oligopeptide/nickel transport system ATPase subunit